MTQFLRPPHIVGVAASGGGRGYPQTGFLKTQDWDFLLLQDGDKLITDFRTVTRPPVTGFALLQDGDGLLLQDGDGIIMDVRSA